MGGRIDRRDLPRLAILAGLALGLAVSPVAGPPAGVAILGTAVVLGALGAATRRAGIAGWPFAALLLLIAALAGSALGAWRLGSIDSAALAAPAGAQGDLTGWVAAVPDRDDGEVRVIVESADGRVEARAPEPVGELPVGAEVEASGTLRTPEDFEAPRLARDGVERILQAATIETTGARRGGLAGALDAIRSRSEAALGRGAPEAEAALLRGFVLGQDERIDPVTEDAFRRSGLSHLLAVSGQNVVLLAVLAIAVLSVLGASWRDRLLVVVGLIAIYVPVAGAGPSILRAGAMGVAGLLAALAGRPASRWYALAGAALVTLVIDPRATLDVGWQLSFAAVIGILAFAAPLRDLFLPAVPSRAGPLRRGLAEGLAVTLAATVATAPLMAASFGQFSITSLLANLLVLPAIAPLMWLGMAAAFLGQLGFVPVDPIVWLASRLAAYVEQVAAWMAAPSWAQVELEPARPLEVIAAYAALGVAGWLVVAVGSRRKGLGSRAWLPRRTRRDRGGRRGAALAAAGLTFALAVMVLAPSSPAPEGARPDGTPPLRVTVLDVGQGDAILVEPRGGGALLIDAGPEGSEIAAALAERGIERLSAVVVSHADDDHIGGLGELAGRIQVGRVIRAAPSTRIHELAAALGARELEMTRGEALGDAQATLEALWPPVELIRPSPVDRAPVAPDERNNLGLVLLLRWRGFEMLLPGDAEAEAVPLQPGPVDVIKLAHHGSADAGLGDLLERSGTELGVISVGAGNPYGHPTPETLAELSGHGVETLRTDLDGDVVIDVERHGWEVSG